MGINKSMKIHSWCIFGSDGRRTCKDIRLARARCERDDPMYYFRGREVVRKFGTEVSPPLPFGFHCRRTLAAAHRLNSPTF